MYCNQPVADVGHRLLLTAKPLLSFALPIFTWTPLRLEAANLYLRGRSNIAIRGRTGLGQGVQDDTDNRPCLSRVLFADAATRRDPDPVVGLLAAMDIDDDRIEELAGLIRRTGSLIVQRPDQKAQKRRDAFLDGIREAAATGADASALGPLDEAIETVRLADEGYLRILSALERTEISKKPPAARAAAAIELAEVRLAELQANVHARLAAGAQLVVPGGIMLDDGHGRRISSDAIVTSITRALGGTLKMDGFAGKWFDGQGRLVLPELADIDEETLGLTEASERLGMAWNRWETFQEQARFVGGAIRKLEGKDLPDKRPELLEHFFTRNADFNFVDWMANERSFDREHISTNDLFAMTDAESRAKGIDGPVAITPAEWISAEEVAQCLSLSEAVGYNVMEDLESHAGLRLVHWVRGYCALSTWAAQRFDAGPGILRTSQAELMTLLERVSFTREEATVFLDAISFARESRDLFDAPLVRTATDWLVVGPAILGPRLAKIVPSLLGSMKVTIERKGQAFEDRALAFFREQGLDAKAVTVWRAGKEYQYDVLVRWGSFLLLIECKNRLLSNNNAEAGYHFLEGVADDIEQITRLKQGLEHWPEIVTDAFGAKAAGLKIVPIVLQNETFSLPGGQDGVFFYDWSALTRFFAERFLFVSREHRIPSKNAAIRNRVAVKSLWAGETPSPEDLLAELKHPHQLKVIQHHMEMQPSDFWIDESSLVRDWALVRVPITNESMAKACGVSPDEIISELDAKSAAIEKACEAFESKEV